MPAHDIGFGRVDGAFGIKAAQTDGVERGLFLSDEPIHLARVDVGNRMALAMRPTVIEVEWVVERQHTLTRLRVIDTHRRHTVLHRNAVRARISAEVAVE